MDEQFYATCGLNASFLCLYIAAIYLLYQFRANGPAFKPGELRRLLISSDSLRFEWYHVVTEEGAVGIVQIFCFIVGVVWIFAFTHKKIFACFVLGLWFKQIFFFGSTLVGLDLAPFALPDDSKLPVVFARRSSFIPRPVAAHGLISLVLARVYLTAAMHVIMLFYFDVAVERQIDVAGILGERGSGLRTLAHFCELLGVLTAVDRLAKLLAATEFLRFHMIPNFYRLVLFTVFSVLTSVLVCDALGFKNAAIAPLWAFAFPISLSLTRAVHDSPTRATVAMLAAASAAARLLPRCFN